MGEDGPVLHAAAVLVSQALPAELSTGSHIKGFLRVQPPCCAGALHQGTDPAGSQHGKLWGEAALPEPRARGAGQWVTGPWSWHAAPRPAAQDGGVPGCPHSHLVCATCRRSLTRSANTDRRLPACLGGLWLMVCKPTLSRMEAAEAPQNTNRDGWSSGAAS